MSVTELSEATDSSEGSIINFAKMLGLSGFQQLSQSGGSLCAERMEWVRAQLAAPGRVLIAMHHPPFELGITWLDGTLEWAQPLHREIARHSAVDRIVCGHAHRAMVVGWAGATAVVCSSTAHQVLPDLRPVSAKQLTQEAPGLVLHQVLPDTSRSFFVSIEGTFRSR